MTKLLYYDDKWLFEFSATVVSTGAFKGKPAVELDQTAFYPEGGGQPADRGVIAGVPVVDCQKANGRVWHVLEQPLPAEVGSPVFARLDAARRFHNMQKHTGQHLLSAVFLQEGFPTVSVHFGEEESTLDLSGGALSSELLKKVEEQANRLAFENIPVKVFWASEEELPALGLRKTPEVLGKYRIVEIEGLDRSACGGTHLDATGPIGVIKILRVEKVRENQRIYFACGWGAYRLLAKSYESLSELAKKMTRGVFEVTPAVVNLIEESQKLRREVSSLREQLLPQKALELEAEFSTVSGFSFLGKMYKGETEEMKKLAQLLVQKPNRAVFLAANTGSWVLLVSPELAMDLTVLVKETLFPLGAKGGGSGNFRQGGGLTDFPSASNKVFEYLKNKLGA
ncbi:MAG: alanine--tRNA ligase-related protein [candidate division Zixibacteria bacterium]|nr:alanine--tRNA ligase-related protein [candidate division Zixibacteria bacterium]